MKRINKLFKSINTVEKSTLVSDYLVTLLWIGATLMLQEIVLYGLAAGFVIEVALAYFDVEERIRDSMEEDMEMLDEVFG